MTVKHHLEAFSETYSKVLNILKENIYFDDKFQRYLPVGKALSASLKLNHILKTQIRNYTSGT